MLLYWGFVGPSRFLSLRNMGDSEPGHDSFQLFVEPAASTQRCPETLQMGVFTGFIGTNAEHQPFPAGGPTRGEPLDVRQPRCLQRNRWSAATLKVLSAMPSRAAGEMKPSSDYRSAKFMDTCKLTLLFIPTRMSGAAAVPRRHQTSSRDASRPAGTFQSDRELADVEEITSERVQKMSRFTEDTEKQQLVLHLRGLPAGEGMRKLRAAALSLADKKDVRYTWPRKNIHNVLRTNRASR